MFINYLHITDLSQCVLSIGMFINPYFQSVHNTFICQTV